MLLKDRIGLCASTFDLLHAGHIHYLETAREHCGHLIACLQTGITDRPEKNKPIQTVYERWRQLRALSCVGRIIPYESENDLLTLLHMTKHHVRFLGSEYIDKPFTGDGICSGSAYSEKELSEWPWTGSPIVFYIPRTHDLSTTELRQRIKDSSNEN